MSLIEKRGSFRIKSKDQGGEAAEPKCQSAQKAERCPAFPRNHIWCDNWLSWLNMWVCLFARGPLQHGGFLLVSLKNSDEGVLPLKKSAFERPLDRCSFTQIQTTSWFPLRGPWLEAWVAHPCTTCVGSCEWSREPMLDPEGSLQAHILENCKEARCWQRLSQS